MAKKLIATQTASSSSSLEFTSGLTGSYTAYKFYFLNLHPSVDGADLRIAASTDGGSNYNVYTRSTYMEAKHDETDSSGGGNTTGTLGYDTARDISLGTYSVLSAEIGADNDQSLNGHMTLYIPSDSTYTEDWYCETSCAAYNDYSHHTFVQGMFNTSSSYTVNAVKFYMSSGNIDDGKIKLFGVS